MESISVPLNRIKTTLLKKPILKYSKPLKQTAPDLKTGKLKWIYKYKFFFLFQMKWMTWPWITRFGEELSEGKVIRIAFQRVFEHCIADNLRCLFVVADHYTLIHVDAFRFLARRRHRYADHVEIRCSHRADAVRRCCAARKASGFTRRGGILPTGTASPATSSAADRHVQWR